MGGSAQSLENVRKCKDERARARENTKHVTVDGGIHDLVGGSDADIGHMTLFWYSAFDPVFWLHHAYKSLSTFIGTVLITS